MGWAEKPVLSIFVRDTIRTYAEPLHVGWAVPTLLLADHEREYTTGNMKVSFPDSRLPTPDSRLPTPDFQDRFTVYPVELNP